MVRANFHIQGIYRDSDVISGREGLICLDRNERVSAFDEGVFRSMLGELSSRMLSTYHDLGPLYERLECYTGLTRDRIALGAGSDAIIRRTFQAFVDAGDRVVAPDPSYRMYEVWAQVFRADYVKVPYGTGPDFRFDIEKLISAVEDGARLCCIANPDQPIGCVLPLDSLRRIASVCQRNDTLLLVDEAYFPFHDETAQPLLGEFDNILVVRTFSKVGGIAGLRVGYGLGAKDVIDALHVVRSPGEVNSVGAVIAGYLLDHTEIMDDFCAAVAEGRKCLLSTARDLGFGVPLCAGNFQLLECPNTISPVSLVAAVKARGYLIKGGFSHSSLRNYVRVTLDGPAVMEAFSKVLRDAVTELRE
ncbi:MAG: histidinol-phosphate aminotransferase family protein [Alphaproteobacteria bacterium]|nr:histidinol-phosphate aminotransferase family protein [Alphaproteobacteria bacterium]